MARVAILNPDGKARPYTLASKGRSEVVTIKLQLGPSFLGTATATSPTWSAEPFGLVIANPTVAADGRSVSALVSEGLPQRYYTVTAQCGTTDGQTVAGVFRIFVDGERLPL